jgi:glycerophosphoryl diester phosphodiesterase
MLQRILSFLFTLPMLLMTMSDADRPGAKVEVNPNATNPYIAQYGKPMVSAHRSGGGLAPENTLMAVEACLKAKNFSIDVFEFDVKLTRDGQLVLLHDPTYDATSNAEEACGHPYVMPSMYTLEQLQAKLNLGENFQVNGKYPYRGLRGEKIPKNLRVVEVGALLSYIEKASKKDYMYIIEIKDGFFDGIRSADRLYSILREQKLLDRVIVGTFWPFLPYYMDWKYPDMARSASILECLQFYFYARANLPFSGLNAKYVALQIPGDKNEMPWPLNQVNLTTREVINYAHKNNVAVQYWTVNSEENARMLRDNGGDAMMSDYPDMICRVYGY